MGNFDELNIRMPGPRSARPSGLRAEAEGYAASLGLTPGGPGWGDAIRDYVLNGGSRLIDEAAAQPMSTGTTSGEEAPQTRTRLRGTDASGGVDAALDAAPADLHAGLDDGSGFYVDRQAGRAPAMAADGGRGIQLSQVNPRVRGRPKTPVPREVSAPIPGSPEDIQKRFDWRTWLQPDTSLLLAPKRRSGGPKPDLIKRHFTTAPRPMDSDRVAARIAAAVRRLPQERRQISQRYSVPLTASPTIDRYYSAIIARENGIERDGTFRISNKGAVGPGQVKPDTAREVARRLGIPFDEWRLHHDQAFNEMLGQAYYQKLLRDFGGDFVKAAAAYDAGPAGAKRAIQAAAKAGEPRNWENYLPRETREYVVFFRKYNQIQED